MSFSHHPFYIPHVVQKTVQQQRTHRLLGQIPAKVTQRRLSTEEFSHPRVEALIDETPEVTFRRHLLVTLGDLG